MADGADDNSHSDRLRRSGRHEKPTLPLSWRPLIDRAQQAFVAGVCFVALLLLANSWRGRWGSADQLIEIDRAERRQAAFQVDINEADWPELAQLPGIGETMARRIVASRVAEGPFASRDDLLRVSGIGPRTMERLRPYLLPLAETGTVAGGVGGNPKHE